MTLEKSLAFLENAEAIAPQIIGNKHNKKGLIRFLRDLVGAADYYNPKVQKLAKPILKSTVKLLKSAGFVSIDKLDGQIRAGAEYIKNNAFQCIVGNCIRCFEKGEIPPPNVMARFSAEYLK